MSFTGDLLDEWELFGRASGWGDTTIRDRRQVLLLLAKEAGAPLEQVTGLQLAAFLAPRTVPATRATYWRHCRSFFAWLRISGYRTDDPTEIIKSPRAPGGAPRPASDAALRAVLAMDLSPNMRAWITLGMYAGLRVHEIAKVRGEDIDTDNGTLYVFGKGHKEAFVPLHPEIARLAAGYPRQGFWFPSARSATGCINSNSLTTMIRRQFDAAGHPVTAHQLRHWYGTHVLRSAGGDLRVAQECLRHSSPATTARYTKVESSQRTAAVLGLPMLALEAFGLAGSGEAAQLPAQLL